MSVADILNKINSEDKTVPVAVEQALQQIERLVLQVVSAFNNSGRLFYIGAGTSGRLAIVDASECPPTFGVPHGLVVGIIAGGDEAIRRAVEGAEDDPDKGFIDLMEYEVNKADIVVGISASGQAPYVVNALRMCRENGITTSCIVCNTGSSAALHADFPVEVLTGPEFVTGSTRMKAGTAQKLVLNMITTAAMIQLGRVEGNKMTHMSLSNSKLLDRGARIIMEKTGLSYTQSQLLLFNNGNDIAAALQAFRLNSKD